jgi:hypothetical protein
MGYKLDYGLGIMLMEQFNILGTLKMESKMVSIFFIISTGK